ncbi:hypothetical protein TrVE_jg4332 [Triparma verrucosa]|uniref:L-asparaginase N-terminal domain-containing protein n=2 Tax=Triparma TaxID=722752 RepID=A0A9W7EUN1_9STRA|nr:hypothetical protein TrST_g6679 [Triparma strigata]GMH97739.1 hypothetical protein TrVE_jg4332 [Triparma verrucosa]
MSLLVLTTGGSMDKTYCGKASDFIVGNPMSSPIFEHAHVTSPVRSVEICRKDSLALTDEDRESCRLECELSTETKIIITHGTDTMWKTAHSVNESAKRQKKTVVLCGAMMPAAFAHSDSQFNLGFATAAVQMLPPGAHVVMNGEIFSDPLKIYKDYDRNIFYAGEKDRNPNE